MILCSTQVSTRLAQTASTQADLVLESAYSFSPCMSFDIKQVDSLKVDRLVHCYQHESDLLLAHRTCYPTTLQVPKTCQQPPCKFDVPGQHHRSSWRERCSFLHMGYSDTDVIHLAVWPWSASLPCANRKGRVIFSQRGINNIFRRAILASCSATS